MGSVRDSCFDICTYQHTNMTRIHDNGVPVDPTEEEEVEEEEAEYAVEDEDIQEQIDVLREDYYNGWVRLGYINPQEIYENYMHGYRISCDVCERRDIWMTCRWWLQNWEKSNTLPLRHLCTMCTMYHIQEEQAFIRNRQVQSQIPYINQQYSG